MFCACRETTKRAEGLFFQAQPLITDERKHHETCITCLTDVARLLLASEGLIYSSEIMLIFEQPVNPPFHNAPPWFGPV